MKHIPLQLTVLATLATGAVTVPTYALESVTTGSQATQATVGAINSKVDASVAALQTKIDGITYCNTIRKFYAPADPKADVKGCVGVGDYQLTMNNTAGINTTGGQIAVSSANSPSLVLGPNTWGQSLEVGGWRSGSYASVMASDGNLHLDALGGHYIYLNYYANTPVYVGPSGGAAIYAGAFYYSSDRRLKDDVTPLKNALDKLDGLEGVTFKWNASKANTGRIGKADVGLIAQDVQKVLPEAVITNPDTKLLAVDYPRLVPLLVNAIKEQQAEIDTLKQQVDALKK
jgi:hypothetical protein